VSEPVRRYVHNIPAARRLRTEMTAAEVVLWDALRDRRLGQLKFRRQHAVGRFVVDFYCHELRLAVELDGGIHLAAEQRGRDQERQSELEETGLRFLRFSNDDVLFALEAVLIRIASVSPPPPRGTKSGEGAGG
jgi:very-short-patch-repair endonuclease